MIGSQYTRGNPVRLFLSRVRAYLSADQKINENAWTLVNLDSEDFDGLGEFNPTTHRFVAAAAGYYLVIGAIVYGAPPANQDYWVHVKKNGAWQMGSNKMSYADGCAWPNCQDIMYLNAGDYLELWAFANTNGINTQVIDSDKTGTYLAIHRLS